MNNVQQLIDATLSYASESAKAGDNDMANLYMEDLAEFQEVTYLISAGYTKAAFNKLWEMDTLPREQIHNALEADGYV